jgi:hypothetical protein
MRAPRPVLAISFVALAAACAGAPVSTGAPPEPSPPVRAEAPPAPSSSVAPPPVASAPPTDPDAGPAACPGGMLLVDGDYCTELEMKCQKSWYAPENRKIVCERFEEPTHCVGPTVKKRYCIDRYEFPNEEGARPRVMMGFYEAQVLCAERGKRVCTESEWTMACEGPERKPFPYGYVRDPSKCLGDRPYRFPDVTKLRRRDPAELERLWQGVPSGSQPACVSDYGVHDMPGNADELAASERLHDGQHDNVTTGGPWLRGVRNQCRPKIYEHDEGFRYYYLSTRCCAEPDGKPTDPRAPKQLARGMAWERVEWLAAHTL